MLIPINHTLNIINMTGFVVIVVTKTVSGQNARGKMPENVHGQNARK